MKKTSANTNYWRAKHHLEKILDGKSQSPVEAALSKSEDTDAGPSKKTRSGTKRGAAKDASTKKNASPPKRRRKTATKATSKPAEEPAEESTQAEETNDTEPADPADQTE